MLTWRDFSWFGQMMRLVAMYPQTRQFFKIKPITFSMISRLRKVRQGRMLNLE
jgi:hypothetical protein